MKNLIADATIKTSYDDHWKGQSETSGVLSRLGIHKRKWLMGSSNGTHKWRCWLTEEQLTAASLVAEKVDLSFYNSLLAKKDEINETITKKLSQLSLIDDVINGDKVEYDEIREILNG